MALGPNAARYRAQSPAERSDAIEQLTGLVSATMAELLDLVAAADDAGDWRDDGATGVAPWLVARCAVATPTAREWARVAASLQDLPALRAAFAAGELSWDQLRPATRFATADTDADLAVDLPGRSAAAIALMARQRRPVTADDAATAHARRSLSWRADHAAGGYRYRGFVPFDQGASINAALDRHAESMGPDPDTGRWNPIATRRADALHDLATRSVGADPDPDRAWVVIHAEAAVLDGDHSGNGFIGDLALNPHGVLRALCDARVEVALHGPDGRTVGVSRASQTTPHWLRRQIHRRDGHCRFPGCERHIRQIHHIAHWTRDHGPTNADNLVGLCWAHHHLVHEGGWTVTGDPDRTLTFAHRLRRRRLSSRPRPVQPGTLVPLDRALGRPTERPPP